MSQYRFVVQRGDYNKPHEWEDVFSSAKREDSMGTLVRRRSADPENPYRLIRYMIFEVPDKKDQ